MFNFSFRRMELSITDHIAQRLLAPWDVSWYIDLGWKVGDDNYLSFLHIHPERVRRLTLDFDEFDNGDDMKLLKSERQND